MGPLKVTYSSLLRKAGLTSRLDQVAQGLLQSVFDDLQWWRFYILLVQPVPVLHCSQ